MGLTFLVPALAYLGCPGKEVIERMSVQKCERVC